MLLAKLIRIAKMSKKYVQVLPTKQELRNIQFTDPDTAHFCTVVECLNEGLEDVRLDNRQDTVRALFELKDYFEMAEAKKTTVIVCGKEHPDGGMKVFFEV